MSQSSGEDRRGNPYENFTFRVNWGGRHVAGFSNISGLRRTTEVVEYREGSDLCSVRKLPGQTTFEAITFERGVTHDVDFEEWASKVCHFGAGVGGTLTGFRKDLLIDVFNEAGHKALSYKVHRCWVSEFRALPELDANGNAVAILTLKLENEGWERDRDVPEPEEPTSGATE